MCAKDALFSMVIHAKVVWAWAKVLICIKLNKMGLRVLICISLKRDTEIWLLIPEMCLVLYWSQLGI